MVDNAKEKLNKASSTSFVWAYRCLLPAKSSFPKRGQRVDPSGRSVESLHEAGMNLSRQEKSPT
jgi:hypothetical protein